MDNNERFTQIERLLTDWLQRSDRQDEFNKYATQQFERIDQRLDYLTGQFNGVIEVLKLSAEAQKQSEEQGRRTDATQAEILRMRQKWNEQDARNQAVEQRFAVTDIHELRIQRLEDETFRKAG